MKFFTRYWEDAASEKQREETVAKYEEHLSLIEARLPEKLAHLARNINFHDGQIIYVKTDADILEILYLIGDLQVGYKSLCLRYKGWKPETLGNPAIEAAIRDQETEILVDEVSIAADGSFIHSLLFWPREEMSIHFSSLDFEIEVLDQRAVDYRGDPFQLHE